MRTNKLFATVLIALFVSIFAGAASAQVFVWSGHRHHHVARYAEPVRVVTYRTYRTYTPAYDPYYGRSYVYDQAYPVYVPTRRVYYRSYPRYYRTYRSYNRPAISVALR